MICFKDIYHNNFKIITNGMFSYGQQWRRTSRRQCNTYETAFSKNFLLSNQSHHATFPTTCVDHDNTQHPPTPYINLPHSALMEAATYSLPPSIEPIVVFNDQSSRFFWIYPSLKVETLKGSSSSSQFQYSYFHVVFKVRVSSKPEILDSKFVFLYLCICMC